MKTLNSNMITFLDITDTKKLDLYIASNLPTTQIYNTNSSTYSPDWTSTNLILTPTVYMNSTDVTSKITFAWYRKSGNDNPTAISTSGKTLTISTNELGSSSGIISYICEAYYDDKTVTNQITFVRVDTGLNGADGTSVTIKGVAYAESTPVTGEDITLYYDEACTIPLSETTSLTTGDGYLVDGYLCVYTISKTFICAGNIQGPKGTDAVTFQIYAPNGYILAKNMESLILQTFAYDGDTEITSGATYQWSQYVDNVWEEISGATESSFTITKEDVLESKSYRCIMTYNSKTHASTVTVQDKSDIYNSVMCISNNANVLTNSYYWVVYVLVYSENIEADPLLGPISIQEPSSPVSGDYWYQVNPDEPSVVLKKYDGTSWTETTDTQLYQYDWNRLDNGNKKVPIGGVEKVKVISCNDFTTAATFQCDINDDGTILTNCMMSLTDVSDPIISLTAPNGVKDGQIWIQKNDDDTFLISVWDSSSEKWIPLNADTKSIVYTSKPSSYKAGDLWIVESDSAHDTYLKGTLLQAQATSTTYLDAHWTTTLKYDSEMKEVQTALASYAQYMTVTSEGLRMGARSVSGVLSPFTALFTNTELAFYEGNDKLVYLSNNTLYTTKAEVETDLKINKSISLQNFQWIIEDNGSMSLIVNT